MQSSQVKSSNPKLFKFNYSIGLHPLFLVILILISGNLIYVSILSKTQFKEDYPQFQLNQSSVFKKLVECSDNSDGVQCFKQYRNELSGDSRSSMSPISQTQLESCLDIVSNNANDLALLLNIQTCYHQADILERAVEFNNSSSGSSWFVIAGVVISLFIQVFIAIHSIVTFIFRNRDFEQYGRNIRYLADNFEILNEKQLELYNTVSSLIGTIKSETRNLQGRLNRGGDVRREIESISENLDKIINEFNQLKGYMYSSCGPTAAILPPPLLETSSISKKLSKEKSSYNSSSKSNLENNDDMGAKCFNTNFTKETKLKNSNTNPEISKPSSLSFAIPSQLDKDNAKSDKSSFDISTTEGRLKWKEYIKDQLVKSKDIRPQNSSDNTILNDISSNQIFNDTNCGLLNLRYQDVPKTDQNNKKFRRIFVLGRGWVSSKKLEQEELIYGPSSFIKLEGQLV